MTPKFDRQIGGEGYPIQMQNNILGGANVSSEVLEWQESMIVLGN